MKKLFFTLILSALFVNVNAQRKNEIYGTLSPMTLTASSDYNGISHSDNYFGMQFGYNRMFNFDETSNFKFVLGGRMLVCGCNVTDDYKSHSSSSVDQAYDMFIKLQAPISLKYVIDFNEKISLEPYAGIFLSYCISGTEEVQYSSSHSSLDLYDEEDLGLKRAEVGGHIGCDLRIKRFVLGVSYNKAFTDFTSLSGGDLKWSGLDFKCGFRF